MSAKKKQTKRSANQQASDAAVSYDEFKEYEGGRYTGMKIGRSHKWYYDQGEWKEKKITPDLWQISYAVTKRRAGRAPEGSGVPVGTEYHWYVLAHQNVQKLNANDYTTSLAGLKFKIAHRRADSERWSATQKTQRKRMIRFLRDVIKDLEEQGVAEEEETAAKKTAAKRTTAKKTAAKKTAAKKTAAKKTTAKKSAAKKTTAKKTTAKKTTAKTTTAKTTTAKKTAAKKKAGKAAPNKQAKKTAAKRTPEAAKKTAARTAPKRRRSAGGTARGTGRASRSR